MMKTIAVAALFGCAACGSAPQDSQSLAGETGKVASRKVPAELASVPADVLAAARSAQPTMTFTEAESEVRDGRNYYDVGGHLPDGSAIELDLVQQPSGWTVVETQRDIAFGVLPQPVKAAAATHEPGFKPVRVIESRQGDGLIIYEMFAAASAEGDERKIEIKYHGNRAELLTSEWPH